MLSTMLEGFTNVVNLVKKASPEILLATGVVGVVGSTILACKATLKADEILDEHQEDMDKIHEAEVKAPDRYTKRDVQVDTTRTYMKTAWKFVKAYGPAVLLCVAAIVCLISSHGIMTHRIMDLKSKNVALTAALGSANAMFTEYRERVRREFGEDVDERIMEGGQKHVTQVTEKVGRKDVTKDVETTVYKDRPINVYARLFGDDSVKQGYLSEHVFKHGKGDNRVFITTQAAYLQKRLNQREFLTGIDFWEAFGFKITPEDWQFDILKEPVYRYGDVIDIGLYSKRATDFMNDDTNEFYISPNFNILGTGPVTGGKYIATT